MAVTVLRCQACGALRTTSTNPDGEFLLQRFGSAHGALDIVIAPLKMGHRILEQRLDNLYCLFPLVQTLLDGRKAIAELAKFLLEPATTQTQIAAAITDVVNGHRSFGQQTRMTKPRAEHQTGYPYPRGERSQRCHGGDGLKAGVTLLLHHRVGIKMIPHRNPMKPCLISPFPEPVQLSHRQVLWARVYPQFN